MRFASQHFSRREKLFINNNFTTLSLHHPINNPTTIMGIFSKIFKKDKDGDASPSATSTAPATGTTSSQAPAASSTGANLDKPQGVILHTNLGDITIALYSEQTPKVRCFEHSLSYLWTLNML